MHNATRRKPVCGTNPTFRAASCLVQLMQPTKSAQTMSGSPFRSKLYGVDWYGMVWYAMTQSALSISFGRVAMIRSCFNSEFSPTSCPHSSALAPSFPSSLHPPFEYFSGSPACISNLCPAPPECCLSFPLYVTSRGSCMTPCTQG